MGKTAMDQAKYVIELEASIEGNVGKSDVVGALHGQTSGLLGEEMDLKELRKHGKVSRMEINFDGNDATIQIPVSLDSTDAALLAASLETVERIGPAQASVKVNEIRDERESKRSYIVKRAKQLLKQIERDSPDKNQLEEDLKKEVREDSVTELKGLPSGPDAELSDELVVVEGEADVRNLLRQGVSNALGLGGSSVPENAVEIAEGKHVTALIDGDRGGELILNELKERGVVDEYAQADEGLEVEELNEKQVHELLRDAEPVEEAPDPTEEETPDLEPVFRDIVGSRAAVSLDEDLEEKDRVPMNRFKGLETGYAAVVDGEVDSSMVEAAENKGFEFLAGRTLSGDANSSQVKVIEK